MTDDPATPHPEELQTLEETSCPGVHAAKRGSPRQVSEGEVDEQGVWPIIQP